MPKDTKTTMHGVARDKKASPSSQWRGLPTKLKDLPNSEQLFSMWANDSFRAPPVVPTNSSIWDAKDPSRPLPFSFQPRTPIVPPPPVAGVAFVTQARAARSKKSNVKQNRPRVLRALHPSSRSDSYGSSPSPSPIIIIPSELQPSFPHLAPPSPPLDYLAEPPSPVKVEEEVAVDLPHASSVSGSEQEYGSKRDQCSPERSVFFSVSRSGSPSTSVATPPCSPPRRPLSSPSGSCLSPLMLGASLSMGDLTESSPSSAARASSDPPIAPSRSHCEAVLSVYEVCRQRKLPPMNFEKPAATSSGQDLPRMGMGLVLPPLRDSADEGRDFDASSQTQRRARPAPYHIPDGPRGLRKEKESGTDLPPLRLLLDQLDIDEQQRVQTDSQSQSHSYTALADKLLIPRAPVKKAPSRRLRRIAKKAESATPAQAPTPTLRSTPTPLRPTLTRPTGAPPCYLGQFKLGAVSGPGVTVTRIAGNVNRAANAVHPQRGSGGLHAF